MKIRVFYICCIVLFLTNCGEPPTAQVALAHGFTHQYIQTSPFKLTAYAKISSKAEVVNVYIEGDGHAWARRTRLSHDPSPQNSTTMQLAALDPNPNVVYLARPCQYSPDDLVTVCESRYWSFARYSPLVVESINQAISKIKQQANADKVNLIGYSGGGALAVLVAAQRSDIASIRTVAGNLDLITMDNYHHTSPLVESLDPIKYASKVSAIPQLHYIGNNDRVVPVMVTKNFANAAKLSPEQIIVLKNVGHSKGWAKHWPHLLEQVP